MKNVQRKHFTECLTRGNVHTFAIKQASNQIKLSPFKEENLQNHH